MVRVPTGSPLTGAPFNVPAETVFDFSAAGSFTVDWAAEANGVAEIVGFSAMFSEVHDVLGPYDLFAVGSGPVTMFEGELSNIVEDEGNLVSADMTVSTTFSLVFAAAPNALLYTQEMATFSGSIAADGSGSGFTSDDQLDVFLSQGDVATDPLAAVSFDRSVTSITAVPEPSSFVLVGLLGLVALRRRK